MRVRTRICKISLLFQRLLLFFSPLLFCLFFPSKFLGRQIVLRYQTLSLEFSMRHRAVAHMLGLVKINLYEIISFADKYFFL